MIKKKELYENMNAYMEFETSRIRDRGICVHSRPHLYTYTDQICIHA
jgi:hypothetical protein